MTQEWSKWVKPTNPQRRRRTPERVLNQRAQLRMRSDSNTKLGFSLSFPWWRWLAECYQNQALDPFAGPFCWTSLPDLTTNRTNSDQKMCDRMNFSSTSGLPTGSPQALRFVIWENSARGKTGGDFNDAGGVGREGRRGPLLPPPPSPASLLTRSSSPRALLSKPTGEPVGRLWHIHIVEANGTLAELQNKIIPKGHIYDW